MFKIYSKNNPKIIIEYNEPISESYWNRFNVYYKNQESNLILCISYKEYLDKRNTYMCWFLGGSLKEIEDVFNSW